MTRSLPRFVGSAVLERVRASSSARLLHVDGDTQLTLHLGDYLESNGYAVDRVESIAAARERLRARQYDALLIEARLPDGEGACLAAELRAHLRTRRLPLLMLSARGEVADRIVGLERGADDYLVKPCHPRELLARINALLRRSLFDNEDGGRMQFGRLEVDLDAHQVRVAGRERAVTAREFAILALLARHAGRVLSRQQIVGALTGLPWRADDRSIDVHVARLRRSIEVDPKKPRHLLTVRGSGYALSRASIC